MRRNRFELWRLLPGAKRFIRELERERIRRDTIIATVPFPWRGLWINEFPEMTAAQRDGQAAEAIRELIEAALAELVECRRRGEARPYEGTAEIHSDGEPPIAYVIDRLERMLGRGR